MLFRYAPFPRLTTPIFCQPWSLLRKALIRAGKTPQTAGTIYATLLILSNWIYKHFERFSNFPLSERACQNFSQTAVKTASLTITQCATALQINTAKTGKYATRKQIRSVIYPSFGKPLDEVFSSSTSQYFF
jgi:hypothetical protein